MAISTSVSSSMIKFPEPPEGYRLLDPGEELDIDCVIWDLNSAQWFYDSKLFTALMGFPYDPAKNPTYLFATNRRKQVISGVGPDAPMTVNENGGKQSKLDYRFDLIDPVTMFALAEVCATGADKYGPWNWRRIGVEDNLNHALTHIYAYLAGDTQDDHLQHAFTRLMFALSLHLTPGESERMKPDEP